MEQEVCTRASSRLLVLGCLQLPESRVSAILYGDGAGWTQGQQGAGVALQRRRRMCMAFLRGRRHGRGIPYARPIVRSDVCVACNVRSARG